MTGAPRDDTLRATTDTSRRRIYKHVSGKTIKKWLRTTYM